MVGQEQEPTGDALLKVLAALGNPHRLRIVAELARERNYVSRLAREIGLSRPLLHMHLQRLEVAGLVLGSLETSESGKAMKYYEVAPFLYRLTPELIERAVPPLTEETSAESGKSRKPGKTGVADAAHTDDSDVSADARHANNPTRTAGRPGETEETP